MSRLTKLLLIVVVIFAATIACAVPFSPSVVSGSGDIIIVERGVSDFKEILVSGVGRVIVTQGETESLTIETDDNLMEYIKTEVKGNTLEIGFTKDTSFSPGGGNKILEPTDGFIFRVSVVDLNAIAVSGAAKFEVKKLKTDQLAITLSGAGDITIDSLDAAKLDVLVSGAGNVDLTGKAEVQEIKLSGFGRYQADDLESQEAVVTISGAGGAEVWVSETLDVTISGAGDVKYYGSPSVTPEISGVGRIQSLGEK
ncbi:MAG: head GIN domain-containing protein [Anaerolineales bacterium]